MIFLNQLYANVHDLVFVLFENKIHLIGDCQINTKIIFTTAQTVKDQRTE